MIRLNLPVAVITIITRRFLDHCRLKNLISLIFPQNNQLPLTYNGTHPSILLGITLGIIFIYRKYRNVLKRKAERRVPYNSNFNLKRLGTQPEIKSRFRRPWYIEKSEAIPTNINRDISKSRSSRNPSRSRRRFALPSLPNNDFRLKPLMEVVDSNSIILNRKPTKRTSHQSTMITDSLLTINDSKQFPNSDSFITENSCLDIQKADDPCHLQPVLNLNKNCIDLISNHGDNMKPLPITSNNSLGSSILCATPEMHTSENILLDDDCKYTDKKLAQLSREILYENARLDDDDLSKISQISPLTSDMSIETYSKKPKKKRRGKLRFTIKKNRRNDARKNSSTTFSIHRTRSGRIYNTGSMAASTASKRMPKKR